ncbi:MAG: DUF2934 domain-containing protein [Solirubrobacteraceae bacterium]
MSAISKSRRRWTDTTIECELRTQIAELGQFPTRAELVARGLRGLWDAMRSAGGADAWRERLERGEVPAAPGQAGDAQEPAAPDNGNGHHPEVSPQRIEQLAYELFEHGAPGSALDHWLEAERTLA